MVNAPKMANFKIKERYRPAANSRLERSPWMRKVGCERLKS